MDPTINVYAVNLPQRTDRRESIVTQFIDKPEFDLHVISAIERRIGAHGLWQTFYAIVESEASSNSDYFIFCEDDHVFTESYSIENLQFKVQEAKELQADLLSGGMSVVHNPVEIKPGLFWVSEFNGMQFTIIFRQCYQKILSAKTVDGYAVDIQLSYLAHRKLVISPFISTQREFGYSDASTMNDEEGRVTRFFYKTQRLLNTLQKIKLHYRTVSPELINSIMHADVSSCYVPTYIINLPERTDRLKHIYAQFDARTEFDVHINPAIRHEIGAVGLWQSICDIVRNVKNAEEDFVLICEDDHVFTENYDRDTFLRQIMLGAVMGAQMLNGGVGDFSNLVPLPGGVAWMDRFWCTQFIIIYKSAYDIILNAQFGLHDVADERLSTLLTGKLVITPFISEQTDFGYSDITQSNNAGGMILRHFANARHKLKHYAAALSSTQSSPADYIIKEYISRPGAKLLHLGCGRNILPDWLNTDIHPTYGACFLDVTQPFTFPDNTFDFVFTEHLIEALNPKRLKSVFTEIYRILKRGGVFRCTFYCSDIFKDLDSANPAISEYCHLNVKEYSPMLYSNELDKYTVTSLALNNLIHRFKSHNIYSSSSMQKLLGSIGFLNYSIFDIDESPHRELQNIHGHIFIHRLLYDTETMTFEITKP